MWDNGIVAVATLVLNVIVLLIGGAVQIARQEGKLKDAITKTERDLEDRIDSRTREFGETANAIRQKITEVEMFMRDNFIKRDSYYNGYRDLTAIVKTMNESMDARLIRMENKIDLARQAQKESGGS